MIKKDRVERISIAGGGVLNNTTEYTQVSGWGGVDVGNLTILTPDEKEYIVSDSMLTSAAHVALLAGLMSNNKLDKDSKSKRSMRMGEEVRLHLHSGAHMDVVVVGQDYRYITGRRIIKTEPAKKRKMVTVKVSDIASFTSLDEDMNAINNMMDNVLNGGNLNG